MRPEVALPVLLPLLTGAVSLLFWRARPMQRFLAVAGNVALLMVSLWLFVSTLSDGYVTMQMGSWPAPFGITLIADLLSAVMVLMTALIGLAMGVYSLATTGRGHEKFGYYPLMHLLLAGVMGAFLTGDIFNLYVWFEVMLVASFALLILGGERAQMEGAIKYVTLNLLASVIFLTAVGLLYGMVGTLNMADIALRMDEAEHTGMVEVLAVMFMVAFGIKAAAFPLFFWLPASYHTPPVAVSALFAGLLTKVGVYAMFRVFTLMFDQTMGYLQEIMLWGAAFTMVTGVLGAAAQHEFRRILSFHIVSQIGYMILGLALYTPLAIAGGVFAIVHNMVVKTNLFLISGITHRLQGTYQLKKMGGLYRDRPWLAVAFFLSAFSLAGIPPLSGFFAKFVIVRAGLEIEAYVVTGIALAVGLMTLYSMVKIWNEVFWKSLPEDNDVPATATPTGDDGRLLKPSLWMMYSPVMVLALFSLLIGVLAEPIMWVMMGIGDQLFEPSGYIEAVLGASASADDVLLQPTGAAEDQPEADAGETAR
ncbi:MULTISPECIES: Na+/H+ antiporter subunit D [Halomonadaceae]|uniref:Na(+)/H(+) antiporter subunit D n=1 Tax=Vreelandella titanicae TaxID=664683 RepID=A0A653UT29_9GAMM|nr:MULTISPECIES: Na+/H+ antiporter subunit D [Halomonas]QKS24318.1 Na(+)/H(+) antiporter subunit D [Halomonas titanicae]CAD5247669.1 Na(+)/H(+) antiporter subunit D [Halomonas sp. 59]CAD5247810.1 Na(+)/H(+) antiporter subunit D [Halomonas sp. 113]CAD5252345.1 Na(+)/H(+) antiporter subunit D [Halomonas sp. 156]CAD5256467.1 Na(+)/H(+) antiporter subunit D [Halomonas sp. I3]